MLKIKEVYGFTLSYDERRRYFVLTDDDSTEVDYGTTQNEAETKAKSLSKRQFKRIPICEVRHDGQVTMGELTSINPDEPSAWLSMEKARHTWGSGREKINLKYGSGYYEATDNNLKILEEIKVKRSAIEQTLADIAELKNQLEKPINTEYFGIKQ